LTLGAFASLQAEYRENDSPGLIGVRANGNPVEIEEMSDGSRDQLFSPFGWPRWKIISAASNQSRLSSMTSWFTSTTTGRLQP